MPYEPQTIRTRWVRDQVLAALRRCGELNTTELANELGFLPFMISNSEMWCDGCRKRHNGTVKRRVTSQVIQPTMISMEKHHEIERSRTLPSEVWRWSLGAGAPPPVEGEALDILRSLRAP